MAIENSTAELWPLMGYALKERLALAAQLRDLIAVQCHPDTLSAGEYMRGMANGLICALAVIEGKDPVYVEAPAAPASTWPPHQQRVVDERVELVDKATKLAAFFDTPIFSGLDAAEQGRLRAQLVAMNTYADILTERIAAF